MTNRITDANIQHYLDILKNQTGLDIAIYGDATGYAITNEHKGIELSRYGLSKKELYEVIYAATRILDAIKKAKEVTA